MGRTLIGGVGYPDLRDFSVGPVLAERLAREPWPDGVVVENLSYGPVAVVHRLNAAEPAFERLLVVGSVRRGRRPGAMAAYRWDGHLPEEKEIQSRVGEAVTGVIGLENLLVVTAALGAAPSWVLVVEIEPLTEELGHEFTPAVAAAAERAAALLRELALSPEAAGRVPEAPLGGFTAANGSGAPTPAPGGAGP